MDEKSILMYYHTAFRNIGLYTSVSIAMLGYSRFYRGKNIVYNVSFILISLVFLVISLLITKHLIATIDAMKTTIKEPSELNIEHLSRIPKYVFVTNIAVFCFGIYTFFREIRKFY